VTPESFARMMEVKRMRESGAKYREIGSRFGVGVERARQIYFKACRVQRRIDNPPPQPTLPPDELNGLPARAYNVCHKHGIFTKQDLMDCPEDKLMSFLNFGEKSLHDVRAFLGKET